jgi:hypothetical protein
MRFQVLLITFRLNRNQGSDRSSASRFGCGRTNTHIGNNPQWKKYDTRGFEQEAYCNAVSSLVNRPG